MEKEELLNYLNRQNWTEIIPILTAYTEFKVKKGKWWKRGPEDLAKGLQPVDIVFGAINDLYTEKRKWNREKYPSVIDFLKSIIDSEIYNLYGSYDHTYQVIDSKNVDEDGDRMDEFPIDSQNTSDILITDELLSKIYKAIEGDQELEEFVLFLVEGYPSRDIAKELDVDISNIYNRNKRLKRILIKILDEE